SCQTVPAEDAIRRDPAAYADNRYDLIIVGGGIYGVTLALESVRRGLRCLLLEKQDFGSQTSFNHLRILHGGLRYLQSLDLRRFRDSVAERSWFLRHLPGLARPVDCLLPLYGNGLHRPAVFRAALALDGVLAADRNRGLLPERSLKVGRVLSVEETAARFPGIDRCGLRGAALWQDGFVPDSPRLLIELLRWACRYGAHALNYCPADGLQISGGRVTGVRGMDRTDGREYHFTAPVVINAAGPWCREVAALADRDRPRLFANRVLVWNLLFGRAPLASCAVAVRPRRPGAPHHFLPPWKGQLLIGTGHVPLAPGEHRPPSGEEVAAMIDDVNEAVPAWNSDRESCGGSITGSCRERAVFGWPADRYWSITVPSRGRRGCTACRESNLLRPGRLLIVLLATALSQTCLSL
ncbi:MAG: FAD-dependent oxidoreductase, partial [Syntrophotaleaceae bacterium]